jgi:hypothetical protein
MLETSSKPLTVMLGLVLVIGVAACGSPGAATPTDAVREAFRLVDEGDLDALIDLTCDAQKETIRQQFEFTDVAALLPGADLGALFEAVNLDTSALTIDEVSSSGDSASVQLGGSLGFSFDAEKLRELLRVLAEQRGAPIDDASLDALVAGLQDASQSTPIFETVDVVREGGSWKICSRLTLTP